MDTKIFNMGTALCSGIYSLIYQDKDMERAFKLVMVEDQRTWWDFLSLSLVSISTRFGLSMDSWTEENVAEISSVLAEGATGTGHADVETAVAAVCGKRVDFSRGPNEVIKTYMAVVNTLAILVMYQVADLSNIPEFILDNVALATDAYTEAVGLASEQ